MEFSIAPVTWFCVHILTQDFTTKKKYASEQGLTFFFPKTMPFPNRKPPFLLLPKLLKFIVYYASEAELGALFVTAQEIEAIQNTLEEIK